MIKINLDEKLTNYKNEIIGASDILKDIQLFYQRVNEKVKNYEKETIINKLFSAIKTLLKDKFKPFIFKDDLEAIINQSIEEPKQDITKRELLIFAINRKKSDEIKEFLLTHKLNLGIQNKKQKTLKLNSKEIKFLIDKLMVLDGVNVEGQTKFIAELNEGLESE